MPQVAARVHATLERLLALGESERAVHPIVTYLRHEIDSIAATDITGIARGQHRAYDGAATRAKQLAAALTSSPGALALSSPHRKTT